MACNFENVLTFGRYDRLLLKVPLLFDIGHVEAVLFVPQPLISALEV